MSKLQANIRLLISCDSNQKNYNCQNYRKCKKINLELSKLLKQLKLSKWQTNFGLYNQTISIKIL